VQHEPKVHAVVADRRDAPRPAELGIGRVQHLDAVGRRHGDARWDPRRHASVRTTLDWYSHLFEGHDDELLADLAGLVREASAPTVPPSSKDVVAMAGRRGL